MKTTYRRRRICIVEELWGIQKTLRLIGAFAGIFTVIILFSWLFCHYYVSTH